MGKPIDVRPLWICRVALAAGLLMIVTAGSAWGQVANGGNVDLNGFRPSIDSRGFITVNSSDVLGRNEVSFGLITNWGRNLLSFEDGDNTYKVKHMISPTLVAAYGLPFVGDLGIEFGLSVPLSVMSGDRDPDSDNGTPGRPNDDESFRFSSQGIGDLGVHIKAQILRPNDLNGYGLAVIASMYLPTTSEKDSWLGEGSLTPQLMATLDKRYGSRGRLRLAVSGGIRVRTGDDEFVDNGAGDMIMTPITNERLEAGPTLPVGAAIAYAIVPQKFDLIGEVTGALPIVGDNFFPLEAVGGVKLYLAENSFLTIGGGTGLIPGMGANPDVRAFIGIVFEPRRADLDGDGSRDLTDLCPEQAEDMDGFDDEDGCPDFDNDGDGILDTDDACPDVPEDLDGVADEDGCPETDADNDKILDEDDKCPTEPEDYDEIEDEDGCPDASRVVLMESEIQILDKIHFEYDSAVIKPESFPILKEVAGTMKQHPEINLVEVQGHTDQRGGDAYNLNLSNERANSVKTFLIGEGIATERLRAKGIR